ncbi:MAG: hypothetical protein QOE65_3085 [Solirubrobacteraceae bacterium]|nr:hypothetical protein [Solirubrobacteraceae bacterium]
MTPSGYSRLRRRTTAATASMAVPVNHKKAIAAPISSAPAATEATPPDTGPHHEQVAPSQHPE